MAKKVPPTRFPDAVAVSYYRDLNRLITELGRATLKVFDEHIKLQITLYRSRTDSSSYKQDGPLSVIQHSIDLIKGLSLNIFTSNSVLETATRFVNNLNGFNSKNMQAQGRIKGIDPTLSEPWLADYMKTTISENVSYITTIKDEYFPKIESIIYQGVKNGNSIKDIRQQLVERVGMSRKRAQFIAVDQSGSVFGQMTAKRHQQMGVDKFKWLTSQDERVRATHKALSNKVFPYTEPPEVGLPGTDYRCRCVAIPVFD
ncbi:minor capsid protein [Peribacillus sp. B-H-3]|uniref:phage head morphogenesis protein n=1 Tax=Peribacillus sp. B-H-3 TaxID=3400420 RepID=UPI003B027B2B